MVFKKLLHKMHCSVRYILSTAFLVLITFTIKAKPNQKPIRTKISRIVYQLKKDNYVHFGFAVGYRAVRETKNKYYKLYLKLKEKATDDELVLLTKDTSKNIVVYAFSVLHSRGYENLKSVFINHVNDTSFYWTAGGCTGFIERVNWYMLRQLNPTSNDAYKNYLTKEEYDKYCIKFKKEDLFFSYE